MLRIAFFVVLLIGPGLLAQEPSDFHAFVGKTGTSVEARIMSVSEDRSMLKLEGRDGRVFESKVTGLSLDDQQFVQRWMKGEAAAPAPSSLVKGKLRAFGTLADGQPIDAGAAAEFDDFVAVAALKHGWLALRENGETLTFSGQNSGVADVKWLGANASWFSYVKRDGTAWGGNNKQFFPESLTEAEQSVSGAGHHAARLKDGSVVVWGKGYDDPTSPGPPPSPLKNIVDIASCQGKIAAVDEDGRVFCWDTKEKQVRSAMLGDGLVDVEGSIFHFIGLDRSGKVFVWGTSDPEKSREQTFKFKATAVRGGGVSRAARREDGTWYCWTNHHSGIQDKINDLGSVPDIAFFNEPSKESKVGFVVWIEQ